MSSVCILLIGCAIVSFARAALVPNSILSEPVQLSRSNDPWCTKGIVAVNGSLYALSDASVEMYASSPVYLEDAAWKFAISSSGSTIISPTGFSGDQLVYTFALPYGTSTWLEIFRDLPKRRKAGVGASSEYFFMAGGNDPMGTGLEARHVYWANATTLATTGSYNMTESRSSFVDMHHYGGSGVAITGGASFARVDVFDASSGTWYDVPVGVGTIRFPAITSDGTDLYVAGGQFVDTSLGGNGGESTDVWRISSFPPAATHLGSLLHGARVATAAIYGNALYIVGGEAYRTGLCCRSDPEAPSRIQEFDVVARQSSVYQTYLPASFEAVSSCSSDLLYVFGSASSGFVFASNDSQRESSTGTTELVSSSNQPPPPPTILSDPISSASNETIRYITVFVGVFILHLIVP